jgi:hypothetical protein
MFNNNVYVFTSGTLQDFDKFIAALTCERRMDGRTRAMSHLMGRTGDDGQKSPKRPAYIWYIGANNFFFCQIKEDILFNKDYQTIVQTTIDFDSLIVEN